jgi:hypothetical protein
MASVTTALQLKLLQRRRAGVLRTWIAIASTSKGMLFGQPLAIKKLDPARSSLHRASASAVTARPKGL